MMAPVWLPKTLLLVVLLSAESYTIPEDAWCYNEPRCAPNTWLSLGHCNGKRQSPIDIISGKATYNSSLGAVNLTGYGDREKLLEIKNTGKTVDIELASGLLLSGPGFPAPYTAKAFHLHWGNGVSRPGSEHYINGKRYAMELHIVHTKNNLSISDAVKDPEGIAVLGFFVEGSKNVTAKTAEAWEEFIKNLEKVSVKGKEEELESTVSLLDLLGSTDLASYYRYLGSLTTPGCNEVVIWTIFTDPILVPPKVVEAFPSELYSTESSNGPQLENNNRPLQKNGDRKVEASFKLHSAASLVSQSATFPLFLFILTLMSFLPA
nr:carbonic anhydrase 4-like [Pogona vitticeps]